MLALVFSTTHESQAALGTDYAGIKEGQWQEISIHGRSCLQVLTGIGPINTALVLGKVLATYPSLGGVINLGIGGSFDLDEIPLGSHAIASEEIWPEFGVRQDQCVHARAIGFPLGYTGHDAIWERISINPDMAADRMGLTLPVSIPRTPFITVAGVTSTQERAMFLQTVYRVAVENMEGFALALACATHGIPFLEIRTISNLVGPRNRDSWQIKKAFAGMSNILSTLFDATKKQGNS